MRQTAGPCWSLRAPGAHANWSTYGESSAGVREAEVDLARARVRPAGSDDLAAGVELDPLRPVHVQVAEERRLPATEAVIGDGHGDRHIDADHAHVDVELELARGSAVAGEDRHPVAVRVVVDQLDRLRIAGHWDELQHRAEDLVAVALLLRRDAVEQRDSQEEPLSIAVERVLAAIDNELGALLR